MWGPQTIAKLVQRTPITMVYDTDNSLLMDINGFINHFITGGAIGGPHIVQ